MTFGWYASVPLLRKPKGQLLAGAPEAESKGGLKTDKDEGLQGFASISSGYSNYSPK